MDDLIENTDFRFILEFCMDMVSAIWEKRREDLIYKYSELVQIGQIGFFLVSLVRDEKHEKMEMRLFRRLAANYGIFQIDTLITIYSEDMEEPKILINEDGTSIIKLRSYKEIIECCKRIWKKSEEIGLIDEIQKNIIRFLISTMIPRKIDYLKEIIKNKSDLREIIEHCKNLGLIVFDSEYYLSQKFFQNINRETMDLMTEYDLSSGKVITEIETIKNNPAYPLESIDERIQNAIIEGAFKGVLVPVPIKMPDNSSKYFVFTNPTHLETGDLAYETAAYFRFNEVYAVRRLGRLISPTVFLDMLIEKGIAGNATNIGLNYFPLEVKSVIKVVEGSTSNRKRMVSLKTDTLKEAREILRSPLNSMVGHVNNSPSWLSDPAGFRAVFSGSDISKKGMIDLKKILRDMG